VKLVPTLTLAALLACHAAARAAGANAQSGRVKRADPVEPARGDYTGDGSDRAGVKDDGSPVGMERVYGSREVTRKAVIKSRPTPDYPRAARSKEVQGVVRLRIILRSDGRVDDRITVLKSLPEGVTEEAIKAARRIKFEPALEGDRKVSQYAVVEYKFNIY
jgi:TonB family protein